MAVRDLALRERRHAELMGPNGRTMPRPEQLDDYMEMFEIDTCVADCLRAVGTALGCITAAAVLIAGAPLKVQRAEGSWLLKRPD
jgi:hypothetical protein